MLRTEGSKSRSCGIKFLEPRRREGAKGVVAVQGYEFYYGAVTAARSFGYSSMVGFVIKNRSACS